MPPPTPGWVAAPKSAWEVGSKSDAELTTHTNTERATAQRHLVVEVVVADPKLPPVTPGRKEGSHDALAEGGERELDAQLHRGRARLQVWVVAVHLYTEETEVRVNPS